MHSILAPSRRRHAGQFPAPPRGYTPLFAVCDGAACVMSLQEGVLRLLRDERLVPPDGRVFAALSGGADSVALTLLLREIAPAAGFVLAGVVHLNHGLRAAAAADERFCRELAARLALPIEVRQADVRGLAARERISLEAAGHRARYALFERVAGAQRGRRVATGHTRDDLAETYLMRAIRGAGPGGLAGIRPRAGRIVRPLLQTPRSALRAYLAARGQAFRNDETNRDPAVTRNRVRRELVPLLAARFSPAVVEALARGAAIARADAEWIDAAVDAAAPAVVACGADGAAVVDAAALARQPRALARRLARRALEHAARRPPGFDRIERFVALAGAPAAGIATADFPGCRVERDGARLVVRPAPSRAPAGAAAAPFRYDLHVPGRVRAPEAGLEIAAERAERGAAPERLAARGDTVAVAARGLRAPLVVRSWRPGDALRPLGLGGRKKLQDLFVDHKVARPRRSRVPIVAERGGAIVWVVGHALSDDFRITPATKDMLVLKARKLGGTA